MTTMILFGAALLAARIPAATAAETPVELRELVRKSLAGLNAENERRDQFLFKVRNERKELDAAGKVATQTSYVWERIEIEGFTFGRTLERNGKPLTAEERAGEEKAVQKRLAELKAPPTGTASVGSAAAAPARQRQQQQQQRDWFQEFPDALDYKLAGEEIVNGRPALHLLATPRPGYQPKNMRARVFEKMRGDLWVDKATAELAKVDAEMFDTVSVGFGILGKIEKGTRFQMQRQPVGGDATAATWLMASQSIRFGARFLLVKSVRNEITTQWSEFRRRPVAGLPRR